MQNSQSQKSTFDKNIGTLALQGQLEAINLAIQTGNKTIEENKKTLEEQAIELEAQKKTLEDNAKKIAEQDEKLKTQSETIAKNDAEQNQFDEDKKKTQELIAALQKNQKTLDDALIVSQNEYDALVADIAAARTKFDADKTTRENFLSDILQKIEENEPKLDEQAEVLNVLIATADAIKKENEAALLVVGVEKAAALDEIAQSKTDTNNELKSLRVKISASHVELQQEQILVEGEKAIKKQLIDENDAEKKKRADEKAKLDEREIELDKREEKLIIKEANLVAAKRKALIDVAHIAEQKQIKLDDELIKSITA